MFKKFEKAVLDGIQSKAIRRMILISTLIAFILSVLMIAPSKMVLAKMLPGKNNDTFNIYATLANGSSVEQTKQVTDCIVGYVQKENEVVDIEVCVQLLRTVDWRVAGGIGSVSILVFQLLRSLTHMTTVKRRTRAQIQKIF